MRQGDRIGRLSLDAGRRRASSWSRRPAAGGWPTSRTGPHLRAARGMFRLKPGRKLQPPSLACPVDPLHRRSSERGECGLFRAGVFQMGAPGVSERRKVPPLRVRIQGFWMDPNRRHQRRLRPFVAATHYRTLAERPLDPKLYPQPSPRRTRLPSSIVFVGAASVAGRSDPGQWWRGSSRAPTGVTPTGRRAPCKARRNCGGADRLCRTPWAYAPVARARPCRPKRSGNTPPAAA